MCPKFPQVLCRPDTQSCTLGILVFSEPLALKLTCEHKALKETTQYAYIELSSGTEIESCGFMWVGMWYVSLIPEEPNTALRKNLA